MYVLAFDQDWTVDVNPHPNREAVPLDWVRFWAHEADHEVWAIGNQDLVYEAGIPGVVEAVRRYYGDIDVLGEQDENDRYESWPSRERRLELLAELFPDAARYIAVDDLDLSHVDGWDHYTAWEFRDEIKTGSLKFLNPPSTDTESTSSTNTRTSYSDRVDTIRQQLQTAQEVRVSLDESGTDTIRSTSWTQPRPSALPIDAPPTRDFTTSTGETRRIQLPDISDITILEAEPGDPDTDTNSGQDIEYPDATIMLPRSEIVGSFSTAHRVQYTVDVLRNATVYSALPVKLMGQFRRAVDNAPDDAGSPVVQASKYAAQHPSHLRNHVDDLIQLASASNTEVSRRAIWCLMDLAEEDPTAVLDAAPALVTALESDDDTAREYATYALTSLSEQYPEELLPALDTLLAQVETENNTIRTNTLAAVGHIVTNYPDTAVEHVDAIATLLESDKKRVRNNAVGLLADIAQEHPDVVVEYADALAVRLTDPNIQARINASIALMRAGEANPEAVRNQHQYLEAALEDASPDVRANACTLIANANAPVPKEKLRELRASDPNDTVRDRAAKAINRLTDE